MQAEARQAGHANVRVHLFSANLQQIAEQPQAVEDASQTRLVALLAELGEGVLPQGHWTNGMGQAQLQLTLPGLDRLRSSAGAISFRRGTPWQELSGLYGLDGGLQQIEQSIARDGFADIEIIPNIDGLQFELQPDGSSLLSAEAVAVVAALDRLRPVLQAAGGVVLDRQIVQAARVRREGLLLLAYSESVRHLRPKGFIDSRPREVDPALIEASATGADVQFILTLRSSISGGRLSWASRHAVASSHRAALQGLLEAAGQSTVVQDFSALGAAHVRMNAAAFKQLLAGTDKRWLAATPLRVVGTPQLNKSAASMNMSAAWNLGYFGAGQTIIVLDTGVEASHPFLGGRVSFQACFGTTDTAQVGFSPWTAQFKSHCPGGNEAPWDSPPGTADPAAPIMNSSHGTHVAGIAAGGLKTQPAPVYRGLASAANIAAVQVFSEMVGSPIPSLVNADLLAALNLAVAELPALPSGQHQPFTLNMSFASGFYLAACTGGPHAAYANAVSLLTNVGIPVVAATGNGGYDEAIGFPACLPHVIKVTASVNDWVGNKRAWFQGSQGANVVNPISFGGTHFIAPGGGMPVKFGPTSTLTSIDSSVLASQHEGSWGTSMAAPHIAAVYAIAKGVNPSKNVAQWTAWFVERSIPTTVTTTNPPSSFSINRIFITIP